MEQTNKSPWPGPAGLIPVTSGRADDANLINRHYLDQILVEMRTIDAQLPDLHKTIFQKTYATPIMMPAFSHLNKVGENGLRPMEEYALAAKECGMLNWVGMEDNDTFAKIAETKADTVRIIKPFADRERIKDEIRFSVEHHAAAVGIDIDHIAGKDGKFDVVDGISLGAITLEDLKEYVSLAGIPFIAKGVLSLQDAMRAKEAGCAAIVVSHHHGRIPYGIPPASILPDIKRALEGSGMLIFADCSVESGYDAFKLLSLGADAVCTGRAILAPLLKDGKDGVVKKITQMNQQLSEMMLYTGTSNTDSFDPTVLHNANPAFH